MKFNDQVRFVRQNMKKNKTRLFMTVLATAMGCAFLIVLASVGFGLQKSIVDRAVGDRLVTAIDIYGIAAEDGVERQIDEKGIAYLRSVDHVKAVTYRNNVRQTLRSSIDGTAITPGKVINVDFAAETKAGFELSAGRLPQADDEVVVGYHIRMPAEGFNPGDELPSAEEWLGKTMSLEASQFEADGIERKKSFSVKIVGIAAKPTREWLTDNSTYIGSAAMAEIEGFTGTQWGEQRIVPDKENPEGYEPPGLQDPRQYNQIQVIADSARYVKDISEEIRGQGYFLYSVADDLKQINLMFFIMKIGLVFVGTIAVLIASIGIYNTMTMAVTERAQDIGIMKAIGAHPSAIRRIFLLESAMIGLLGALIGTAVAYVISIAVNAGLPLIIEGFMDEKVPDDFRFSLIPGYLAALSGLISLAVALLSGSRPARRATRIDVLRALRRDL
ncbi:ABC transporter permease [Cohnella cellulosilytica]|uniref:ABC transporter permease n=1 Tax=Cohnella cellulosilytica TaxID=986710 RepID=A0ABW2FDN8_9BACL